MSIKQNRFWVKVFFYSPITIADYKNTNLYYVEQNSLISVTTNTSVNETAGTFSITLANDGLQYLVGDDAEACLSSFVKLESEYLKANKDKARTFNYFKDNEAFLKFKHETVIEGTNRYRVYYEITPTDYDNAGKKYKSVDIRKNRWFFRKSGATDIPVFIRVVENSDGTLSYYDKGTGKQLSVEVHYNEEFYTKYYGDMSHTQPAVKPMDYVMIFMSNKIDDIGNVVYNRVFTGVVNKVTMNRSGSDSISIDGEDITKFLRLSVFATNPSLYEAPEIETGGQMELVYDNNLAGRTAPDIIKLLVADVVKGSVAGSVKDTVNKKPYSMNNETNGMGNLTVDGFKDSSFTDDKLNTMFLSINKLNIQNPKDSTLLNISQYEPYRKIIGSNIPDLTSEFRDRLSICRDIAKIVGFEFFADPDGVLWFREPNLSNYAILNAYNPDSYVLTRDDMRTYSISEEDNSIITMVRVNGTMDYIGSDQFISGYSSYINPGLTKKFGIRILDTTSPLVGDDNHCCLYAKSLMRKINADVVNGQVTIDLRPDLRAGNGVYIPEINRVFYISTVSHSYVAGSDCTTSLGLQYGRVPWDTLPETFTFDGTEKSCIYGTDGRLIKRSQDINADTNNEIISFTGSGFGHRVMKDLQYVIFHHGYLYTKYNYDFVIDSNGDIWTTPQWDITLNGNRKFLSNDFNKAAIYRLGSVDSRTLTNGGNLDNKFNYSNVIQVGFSIVFDGSTGLGNNYPEGNGYRRFLEALCLYAYRLPKLSNNTILTENTTINDVGEAIISNIYSHGDSTIGDSYKCNVGCTGNITTNIYREIGMRFIKDGDVKINRIGLGGSW